MTMPEEADEGGHEDDEPERHVVTVFLRNAGEVLIRRRRSAVGTDAGCWGGVSGDAEGDPDAAARWEIDEETGLGDAVTFVRRGDPVRFTDDERGQRRVVHPFLFDCARRAAGPNEEGSETAWVAPTELLDRETVPELWTAYDRVRPTVEAIAHDTEHGSAWLSLRALEVLRDEAGQAWRAGVGNDPGSNASAEWATVVATAEALLDARPTMAALENRVNRAMSDAQTKTARAVERAARETFAAALAADERAATAAAERLAGETVLTLSRSGTVERALSTEPEMIYVAESRPALEGVGVAERLAERGREVTLVTDAAVAHVLSTDVDRVVVGADTVLPDGSVVNKTGTRGAALVARAEGIPVDVVTAADKITTAERVVGESGPATEVYDGDAPLTVANPTFDRTPSTAVTGVVTDRGVLDTDTVGDVAEEFRALAGWHDDL